MRVCPHCGSGLDPEKGKPRSVAQLRRFHGLVRAVFYHWPETHAAQFGDEVECRKWLQMKAGYREIGAQIPLCGMPREKAMLIVEAAIRGAGSYALPVLHGDTLVVFKPKSIAFAKMGPADFSALNDAVSEVITKETGLDPDQLLREHGSAA